MKAQAALTLPGMHVVRTVRHIPRHDAGIDVEATAVSEIDVPRCTYGIALEDATADQAGCTRVDFGPPWGVLYIEHADLVDAAAVLGNAKRAITLQNRPWRNVLRRALRSLGGAYLRAAVQMRGFNPLDLPRCTSDDFHVEAYLYGSWKKGALELLDEAIALASPEKPGPCRRLDQLRRVARPILRKAGATRAQAARLLRLAEEDAVHAAHEGRFEGWGAFVASGSLTPSAREALEPLWHAAFQVAAVVEPPVCAICEAGKSTGVEVRPS